MSHSRVITLPSSVTAAKTVAECGDQAASPTGLLRSKDMTGRGLSPSHSLSVQSADADRKMRWWMLFHFTAYTVMSCPAWCMQPITDCCDWQSIRAGPSSTSRQKRSVQIPAKLQIFWERPQQMKSDSWPVFMVGVPGSDGRSAAVELHSGWQPGCDRKKVTVQLDVP